MLSEEEQRDEWKKRLEQLDQSREERLGRLDAALRKLSGLIPAEGQVLSTTSQMGRRGSSNSTSPARNGWDVLMRLPLLFFGEHIFNATSQHRFPTASWPPRPKLREPTEHAPPSAAFGVNLRLNQFYPAKGIAAALRWGKRRLGS